MGARGVHAVALPAFRRDGKCPMPPLPLEWLCKRRFAVKKIPRSWSYIRLQLAAIFLKQHFFKRVREGESGACNLRVNAAIEVQQDVLFV
jgi:hypothetical protein